MNYAERKGQSQAGSSAKTGQQATAPQPPPRRITLLANPSNASLIGLSNVDARHFPIAKCVTRGGGIAVAIPWKISKKFGWQAELTEFVITDIQNDGTLILKPQARPTKWAISEGGNE